MAFWWLLAYVMVAATALALPIALGILFLEGVTPQPATLVLSIVAAMGAGDVVAILFLLAYVAYFKVYVMPDGLRACNFWGSYRTVAWLDVLAARPVNIAGLRFLRVGTARARTPLWVPLFLSDFERFVELVCHCTGPEHLLARALHEEMTGAP